jgi:hypothetical protein
MQKEYGKLTEDQFQRLGAALPQFRQESTEFQEAFASASADKIREIIGDGIWWAPMYEFSMTLNVAFLIYVLGEADRIKQIASLPDPQEILLKELEEGRDFEWDGGPNKAFEVSDLVALIVALQRNVLSIMIYKRSICTLVQEVNEGNDDSLFAAVRVDPTAMSCPSIAARISKAVLVGDKRFYGRLKSAMKGPTQKHWENYKDLRYSLAVLREMGFDQMTDAELEHLLVKVLKVYPDHPGARKSLRKQYAESKKIKSL